MRIPGISELTDGEEDLLPTLFLLEGPLGVGKEKIVQSSWRTG